jgi:hypothetical protein
MIVSSYTAGYLTLKESPVLPLSEATETGIR